MTKIIDKLVSLHYVMRRPSSIDRRIINLGLTEKGRELFSAHMAFHEAMCQSLTNDLNENEFSKMVQAIDNLLDFLSQKSASCIGGEIKQHGRNTNS